MKTKLLSGLLAMSVVFGLSACVTNSEDRRRPLPDYAVPLNFGWLVNCPGETVTSEYRNPGAFYDEDGVLLSQERFCELSLTGSRIRR